MTGNVAELLAQAARRNGWLDRPAYHADDRSWTHGEVHELAAGAATVLREHGVGPGDRVVHALADGIDWIVAFLAAARIGAAAAVANPELPAADHERVVAEIEPRLVISGEALRDHFGGAWLDAAALRAGSAPAASAVPAAPLGSGAPLLRAVHLRDDRDTQGAPSTVTATSRPTTAPSAATCSR